MTVLFTLLLMSPAIDLPDWFPANALRSFPELTVNRYDPPNGSGGSHLILHRGSDNRAVSIWVRNLRPGESPRGAGGVRPSRRDVHVGVPSGFPLGSSAETSLQIGVLTDIPVRTLEHDVRVFLTYLRPDPNAPGKYLPDPNALQQTDVRTLEGIARGVVGRLIGSTTREAGTVSLQGRSVPLRCHPQSAHRFADVEQWSVARSTPVQVDRRFSVCRLTLNNQILVFPSGAHGYERDGAWIEMEHPSFVHQDKVFVPLDVLEHR